MQLSTDTEWDKDQTVRILFVLRSLSFVPTVFGFLICYFYGVQTFRASKPPTVFEMTRNMLRFIYLQVLYPLDSSLFVTVEKSKIVLL